MPSCPLWIQPYLLHADVQIFCEGSLSVRPLPVCLLDRTVTQVPSKRRSDKSMGDELLWALETKADGKRKRSICIVAFIDTRPRERGNWSVVDDVEARRGRACGREDASAGGGGFCHWLGSAGAVAEGRQIRGEGRRKLRRAVRVHGHVGVSERRGVGSMAEAEAVARANAPSRRVWAEKHVPCLLRLPPSLFALPSPNPPSSPDPHPRGCPRDMPAAPANRAFTSRIPPSHPLHEPALSALSTLRRCSVHLASDCRQHGCGLPRAGPWSPDASYSPLERL